MGCGLTWRWDREVAGRDQANGVGYRSLTSQEMSPACGLPRLGDCSFRRSGKKHFDPMRHHQALRKDDHEPPRGASLLSGLPTPGLGHAEQQPHPLKERALPHLHRQPDVRRLPEVSMACGGACGRESPVRKPSQPRIWWSAVF